MASTFKSYPVPPNSVYVWRGFMNGTDYSKFINFLGSIFVPACALLQPKVGLRAYIPSLVPQEKKAAAMPDQTALMWWANDQAHDQANRCLAVRAYQNLHGDAYDMTKSKLPEIPVLMPTGIDQFIIEQPYYLFSNVADWMLGSTKHSVFGKPPTMDTKSFLLIAYDFAISLQQTKNKNIDGAIVCCGSEYLAIWVHFRPNGRLTPVFDSIKKSLVAQLDIVSKNLELKAGLWNDWPGIDFTKPVNQSINFQFTRSSNITPQQI